MLGIHYDLQRLAVFRARTLIALVIRDSRKDPFLMILYGIGLLSELKPSYLISQTILEVY